jgi:hypothetical protein
MFDMVHDILIVFSTLPTFATSKFNISSLFEFRLVLMFSIFTSFLTSPASHTKKFIKNHLRILGISHDCHSLNVGGATLNTKHPSCLPFNHIGKFISNSFTS